MAYIRRMMTPLEKALAVNAYAVDKVKIEIIAKALCRSRSTIYTVLKSRKVIRKTGPIPHGTRSAADYKTRDARIVRSKC